MSNSPWGQIQSKEIISSEVLFVSTARHGGYKITKKAESLIPEEFRSKDGWYEEDSEYVLLEYFIPQYMNVKEENKEKIIQKMKDNHASIYEKHTGIMLKKGESRQKDGEYFIMENKDNYIVKAAFGSPYNNQAPFPEGKIKVIAYCPSKPGEKSFWVDKEKYSKRDGIYVIDRQKDIEISED